MKNNRRDMEPLYIEGEGKIIFNKRFGGNDFGKRTFSLRLDPELADMLYEDGWNVQRYSRDENEPPIEYISVEVKFRDFHDKYDDDSAERMNKKYNPKVYLVTKTRKTLLDESNIQNVDRAWIESVTVRINPFPWKVGSKSGVKAYLDKMYVVIKDPDDILIKDDPMDAPFANIPDGELDETQW